MKKLLSALALLTAFAMVATSCDDDDTVTDDQQPSKIPVESVTITPATASVVAGQTLTTLKAEVKPENATDKTVTWGIRGDKDAIATIDPKTGVVTGVSASDEPIKVYATADGKIGFCEVTVTAAPIRVEKVELNKTELPLFVGRSETLTATITPENATYPTVTWTTSDDKIATVDENGKVTAVAEGRATITATADEVSATCQVIVSIPDISVTAVSNIADGDNIAIKGVGLKAGDQVQLEAVVGEAYTSGKIDLTANNEGATFAFPGDASKDRSYKMTILREDAAKAIAYVRPDNEFVTLPYHLGYYMVGEGQVEGLENDPSMRANESQQTYRGYVDGKMAEYDPEAKTFKIWKKDAALAPLVTGGTFDMTYATGVTDISPLFELFGQLTDVDRVYIANSSIETLDMTQFPNATILHAWGDPGSQLNKLAHVNFGTYTDDEHASKLGQIQIERNQVAGTVDLRNCRSLTSFTADDNRIEALELGEANVDPSLAIYSISAKNNQLVELNISNCGQLRQLNLAGNKMERMTLLNNTKDPNPTGATMQQYLYLFKTPDCIQIDWASADEAKGERVINVEHYWWRVFSESGNYNENNTNNFSFFGFDKGAKPSYAEANQGWLEHNPVVDALKDGFKVICWTYNGEDSAGDAHVMDGHIHEGGSAPCN